MSLDAFITKFGGWTEEYKFYNDQITLRYDVKAHIYYLLNADGELEPLEGVTGVCHIIDKSEALIPWACKMMATKLLAEGAVTMPDGTRIMRQMSNGEFESLVIASKTAHKDKLEEAGEVGHIAHDWVEQYIKSVIAHNEPRKLELLAKFPSDERARNCCFAALDWMTKHNVRWLGTERKIFSRMYKYAGTLDGLCMVDSCQDKHCCKSPFKDRLTVSDWKTSNYLYPEYLLQTAAYMQAYIEQMAVEDPHGPLVTDRWIIRLGKEDGEFQTWHAGWDDFKTDIDAFLTALKLKRTVEAIKLRTKTRENATREEIKAERKAAKEAEEQAEREQRVAEKAQRKLDAEEALKLKCKGADKYQGKRKPGCNGGTPCTSCLTKYAEVQAGKPAKKSSKKKENHEICNEVSGSNHPVVPITDPRRLLGR